MAREGILDNQRLGCRPEPVAIVNHNGEFSEETSPLKEKMLCEAGEKRVHLQSYARAAVAVHLPPIESKEVLFDPFREERGLALDDFQLSAVF